ncbi:MAG: hypothetical protein H6736_07990 [Alphaproteobacteria bacterium]|nr:hypothetical protein [Alphaproteobacteria bacterium]MCB9691739.1 hypothetical protein [Alphaproteobacteria bacterium]
MSVVLLLACGGPQIAPAGPPVPPATPGTEGAVAVTDWDVVDATGVHVGTVRIGESPPYAVEAVKGDVDGLVAEIAALHDLEAHGGTKIPRTDTQFAHLLRAAWLRERGYTLRTARSTDQTRPVEVRRIEGDRVTLVGTGTLDDQHYVDLDVEPPVPLGDWNGMDRQGVETAPPDGIRGEYARIVPRASDEMLVLLREGADASGLALVRAGVGWEGPFVHRPLPEGRGSVLTPASLVASAQPEPVLLGLSGPPGGPLGVVVRGYGGVEVPATLATYVRSLHGDDPGFVLDRELPVEAGLRSVHAAAFRTGEGFTRADHLLLVWPAFDRDTGSPQDRGLSVEVYAGGRGDSVDVDALLAHPDLAPVLASLVVAPHR